LAAAYETVEDVSGAALRVGEQAAFRDEFRHNSRSGEPNASRKLGQRKARPAAISVRFPFTDSCRASVA